jgi:hypothetical protein
MEEVKKQGMESLFVPYEIALELKKLGFNEPCFGYYYSMDNKKVGLEMYIDVQHQDIYFVQAPLYQQAFRWFYWKHHIKAEPLNFIGDKCTYRIHNGDYNTPIFYIPEEAELECLKKLIEIVKEK